MPGVRNLLQRSDITNLQHMQGLIIHPRSTWPNSKSAEKARQHEQRDKRENIPTDHEVSRRQSRRGTHATEAIQAHSEVSSLSVTI
jgi:hypothetical protein